MIISIIVIAKAKYIYNILRKVWNQPIWVFWAPYYLTHNIGFWPPNDHISILQGVQGLSLMLTGTISIVQVFWLGYLLYYKQYKCFLCFLSFYCLVLDRFLAAKWPYTNATGGAMAWIDSHSYNINSPGVLTGLFAVVQAI